MRNHCTSGCLMWWSNLSPKPPSPNRLYVLAQDDKAACSISNSTLSRNLGKRACVQPPTCSRKSNTSEQDLW